MFEEEVEKIDQQIHEIEHQIADLNNECAEEMAAITGGDTTRVLSYAKEQELNKTIEKFTSKIAKLLVLKEELEEERRIWLEE